MAELAMAVIRYPHPIERALCFDAAHFLHYRQPEFVSARTQDITPSYYDAGLFYFFDVRAFMASGGASFSLLKKTAVEISHHAAIDIDNEEDWEMAELLVKRNGLGAAW
jgi:N-acylneuraminate cytidylyltransferase